MGIRGWTRLGAVAALALAGCGSTSHTTATTHTTPSAPSTSATSSIPPPPSGPPPTSGLGAQTLAVSKPLGLLASAPEVVRNPRAWVAVDEVGPAQRTAVLARLRRLGFVAAARDDLVSAKSSSVGGLSVVEQFHSPAGARAELTAVLPSLLPGKAIAVPGIPGARGYGGSGADGSGDNIVFTNGPYFYLVGIGWPSNYKPAPTTASLVAAAQHLYHRVHH